MAKSGPVSIKLPIDLDRSDKELMDALRGPKGDPGQSIKGDPGDSIRGKDSLVRGPQGEKGDSIRGEKGDKGDKSTVEGPRGPEGPLPGVDYLKKLIREVLQGM